MRRRLFRRGKRLYSIGRTCVADPVRGMHSPAEAPEVYTRLANEKAFPLVEFDWRNI